MSASAPAVPPLKTVAVEPVAKHTATVIFIHGLGDNGYGWKPVAQMFQQDTGLHHVKWVLPHAPQLPVTANMGVEMPSWFDILSFGFDSAEDETGMLRSLRSIDDLVAAEVAAGIPSERIVVGGFSQGGALSILTGVTSPRKYAGVVGLSAWALLRHKLHEMRSEHATTLPIFWGHGTHDPLVKFQFGVDSVTFLKDDLGIPATTIQSPDLRGIAFNAYSGVAHGTNDRELTDVKEWIKRIIPKT
ncbi:Phospholipase/carboxylesterase [Auriscalpium vulgare]|uniref:Phospholipase/carboxylesterase n=1 Tax=Auriscalpium vulgare TaxID=40419 RepID=A0ACB8RII1_9AGAM|nr:Phospholipase/carboxylesterase [Auriscalpium vulgare]